MLRDTRAGWGLVITLGYVVTCASPGTARDRRADPGLLATLDRAAYPVSGLEALIPVLMLPAAAT